MSEAKYRAELACGRILPADIDDVLNAEPDAPVFPRLTRRSLRRAMIAPGVREFDGATVLWRTEQGDLAATSASPPCTLSSTLATRAPPRRSKSHPRRGPSTRSFTPGSSVSVPSSSIREWPIGACRSVIAASTLASAICSHTPAASSPATLPASTQSSPASSAFLLRR